MNTQRFSSFFVCLFLASIFLLSGCDKLGLVAKKTNALGNRPDLDCIIANDFYAVHFSAYLQPSADSKLADPKAAFVPYCQQIPRAGKIFFTADLIDRDIRTTPIAIRLVEVEKTGQSAPDDFREVRTITEIPAKLYPRGAVEAQADIDKTGNYQLFFLIGEALEEDDKFKIPLEVGVDPNRLPLLPISIGIAGLLLGIALFIFYRRKRRQSLQLN
ncbi:MAG: hypothetical protein ABL919_14275 [Methylococcales bacterium]|nr:hypothetical protein [Methylococcaceae bacterium]